MVSLTIGLLVLCACGSFLKPIRAVQEEDEDNGRSFKRELELFENDIQDEWELEDNEYLSRRELQESRDREKKMEKNDENAVPKENEKRWLDVDTAEKDSGKEQNSPAFDDELPKNGEMFQEDIVMDDYVRDVFNGEAQKRDAVSLEKYHWPTRTVHYVFDRDIAINSKRVIKKAIRQYHEHTCVRLVRKRPGDLIKDFIRFISNGSACYSNVGRRGGRQDVSIGYGCLRLGTPIHEIKHVLGFFHEMARPDRDDNVEVHWENIKERLKHNFRKIPTSLDSRLIPYNLNSVMEYSNNAFSKNGRPTITSRFDPARRFGQRCGFSVGDILEINILFKCPEYNLKFHGVSRSHVLC